METTFVRWYWACWVYIRKRIIVPGTTHAESRAQRRRALGAMSEKIPPGMPGAPQKLGFNTYFMWGLCVVVVGVCYIWRSRTKKNPYIGSSIPEEVARVLPSGAWLMKDGSIKADSIKCIGGGGQRASVINMTRNCLCLDTRGGAANPQSAV